MKRPPLIRFTGIIFIITSIIGIIFSLFSIAVIWNNKANAQTLIGDLLNIAKSSLDATQSGIDVVASTLESSETNLTTIQNSLTNLGVTFDSISPSLESSATMLEEDLTQTVLDMQTSLGSAATSAEIIDDTLALLASIQLLGADYAPDVPLHTSLEQVAANLESMPDSLETIGEGLTTTADSLALVQGDIDTLASDIGLFSEDLTAAQQVLDDYDLILQDLTKKVARFETNLPKIINVIAAGFTGFLSILCITQVSVLAHGLEFMRGEIKVYNLSNLDRK